MATVTPGITFVSGETVTPAKLNSAATPTISAIQTADISDNQITTAKIVDANVTDAKLATGAVTGAAGGGKLAASAINSQTVIADPLAATDEFLIWDASASALRKISWSSMQPSGTIIQTATSADALSGWQNLGAYTVAGPQKTIPLDNTIPQSDEGVEIATVTITPTYSNSTIRIYANISSVASSAAIVAVAALFKDSDTNAFRSGWRYVAGAASYHGELTMIAENSPATTSAVTYKLRLAPDTNATLYLGGQNTNATSLGDTGKVVLIAQEIKA